MGKSLSFQLGFILSHDMGMRFLIWYVAANLMSKTVPSLDYFTKA